MNGTIQRNFFSVKDAVRIVRISGNEKRKMYLHLERHIGKKGIIIEIDTLRFNNMSGLEEIGLLGVLSIYTVRLEDGDIIQIPEEMLEPIKN